MSEFKFVQWGRNIPVDYQRLGAMMLNEQYLKDIVDVAPRGVLAWKAASGPITINPGGGADLISALSNISFDVEEDRLISFSFDPGMTVNNSSIAQLRFAFRIDGVDTVVCGGGGFPVTGTPVALYFGQSPAFYVSSSVLTKGTHSVGVVATADGSNESYSLGVNGVCTLVVRDEGRFISAAS